MSMCEHGWRSELEYETGACPECRDVLLVKLAAAEADRHLPTIARLEDEVRDAKAELERWRREYESWIEELEGPTPHELLEKIARLEEELKVSRSQWENLSQSHSSYMTLWEKAESEKLDVIAAMDALSNKLL